MPRKSAGGAGAADQGADHDQQAGEGRQQDRRAQGRAQGGLLGGRHRSRRSSVRVAVGEVLRRRAAIGHRCQPPFAPGGTTQALLLRLGSTMTLARDRRARASARGRRSPSACCRHAAPLRAAGAADRGDGEGRPEPARARCCRASIDGVGETEEVERIELAFLRMMRRLEAERRRAGSAALRAQEEERARVARDLHDEVNQSLTGLLLRLEAVREAAPPELEAELAETKALANQAMRELLSLARQLRPTALDDLGLAAAIAGQVEQLAPRRDRGRARGRGRLLRPRRRRPAGRLPGRPGGALQRRPPQRRRAGSRCALRRARTAASSSRSPTTAAASPSTSPSAASGSAACASARC